MRAGIHLTPDSPRKENAMRRLPFLLLICAVAALGVAGCGGDDDGGSDTSATTTTETTTTDEGATGEAGGASVIKVAADPGGDLAFVQKSLTASPGRNTIEFTNESSVPHDVKVEKGSEEIGGTEIVSGDTAEATVELEAGDYTFFCSVPGHRQAGMEGPLTVK
jgi:plastocyanin